MPVTIRLHDKEDLWGRFHKMRNEMIVTKNGRKMFPKLEFVVEGLESDQYYAIFLQMIQVDEYRYKFQDGEWSAAGRGEHFGESKSVQHHDGVQSGAQWMKNPIHFERLKITNNPNDSDQSHVFLHSMHKYIPVIRIYQFNQQHNGAYFICPTNTVHPEIAKQSFPETEFITVTAYQNDKTKALKIKYNPYAKGFREGGGDKKRISPRSSPGGELPTVDKPVIEIPSPTGLVNPLTTMPHMASLFYPAFFNPYFPFMASPLRLPLQKPFTM